MLKSFIKIIFFVPVIILDGTLLAMLPGGNYFIFSVALLVLLIYKEDPLFSKFKWIVAIALGLFSVLPWYVFIGLMLLWAGIVRHLSGIMFAAKSLPSLILFYVLSYGIFDLLFLAARMLQNFFLKEPFLWSALLVELKFAGIGLLIGGVFIAIIYNIGNYFDKKFASFFFVRRSRY